MCNKKMCYQSRKKKKYVAMMSIFFLKETNMYKYDYKI